MARRRYVIDEQRITLFENEGRGKGAGADYKPWLTVQDVPSTGRSTRILGIHTRRTHHFLSDIERSLFYWLDWEDSVIDIREQFPLDRSTTSQIAQSCNIPHPRFPGASTPMVMTTDILVDARKSGRVVQMAYAVKSGKDLDNARTRDKLEIERIYWKNKQVEWSIVTPAVLPVQLIRNIEWVHSYHRIDDLPGSSYPGFYRDAARRMLALVGASPWLSLRQFCEDIEARLGLRGGEGLMLFRHLLATKAVLCNMETLMLSDQLTMASFRTSFDEHRANQA
ncbi:heteromeric transposase endonuclease subunit TnsA [Acidithiobacillus ferriphilus]|uniref:TnsA endonuclease N-terminal domain-containing protein n=1 Tax=Acidithiobacillus ferriphilus TaxID=1689834 RepID=UPI001C07B5F7|nr:TnsA endonuclease N-terminal domain-containing protein [Acidithiobacillus ferriphilus]MBU2847632.1 heteromeric transposase endonuclease subunit TnsA [Acidithiobacillus ferriphilus]